MACSDIKFCQYCDNVAHRLCIMENANARKHRQQRMRAQTMNSYEASHINHHNNLHKRPPKDHSEFDIKAQLQLPVDRFLCAVCEDSRNADRQFFERMVEKERLEKIRLFYARLIARKMLLFWKQKTVRKLKAAHAMLVRYVRRKMAGKEYAAWQRAQRRVIVVELEQLPKYIFENPSKYLVILCVVDPVKHTQLFRYDKKADIIRNEGAQRGTCIRW
jgi:hypothetical protein